MAAALMLAACTTPIRGLDHDPSFNPISIDASVGVPELSLVPVPGRTILVH